MPSQLGEKWLSRWFVDEKELREWSKASFITAESIGCDRTKSSLLQSSSFFLLRRSLNKLVVINTFFSSHRMWKQWEGSFSNLKDLNLSWFKFFSKLGMISFSVTLWKAISVLYLLFLFIHRGRWCTHHRTLHPTAASVTHRCLPSIHRPPPPLKPHRPVLASSTAVAGLLPTPGRLTTPTPCRTRTPSPTTPLPTSNHSSTSPITPSRPSSPPPAPSWSAGTLSLMMKWGGRGAWCCCGEMNVGEGGSTRIPTLWVQTQVGWVWQEVLTPLYQLEQTLMAPYTAVEEEEEVAVEEGEAPDQCVHSPPIQQLLCKES